MKTTHAGMTKTGVAFIAVLFGMMALPHTDQGWVAAPMGNALAALVLWVLLLAVVARYRRVILKSIGYTLLALTVLGFIALVVYLWSLLFAAVGLGVGLVIFLLVLILMK